MAFAPGSSSKGVDGGFALKLIEATGGRTAARAACGDERNAARAVVWVGVSWETLHVSWMLSRAQMRWEVLWLMP